MDRKEQITKQIEAVRRAANTVEGCFERNLGNLALSTLMLKREVEKLESLLYPQKS